MFPTLLSFTHSSLGMVISMIITSILVLSITTISGRRASFLVLQWILKYHRIFHSLYSIAPSGSCSYDCCAPSKPYFSYSFQWMYLPTLSCLFLSFYIPFGPTSYIHSQYVVLSCFLLYAFYIRMIHHSYLYEISYSSFLELVLKRYKLKPQCILLNYFSLVTSMCCSCLSFLFI